MSIELAIGSTMGRANPSNSCAIVRCGGTNTVPLNIADPETNTQCQKENALTCSQPKL